MVIVLFFFFSCFGHEERNRKMLCKESFLLSAIAIEQQPQREVEKTEGLLLNLFDYQLCVKDAKEDRNRSTPML